MPRENPKGIPFTVGRGTEGSSFQGVYNRPLVQCLFDKYQIFKLFLWLVSFGTVNAYHPFKLPVCHC